MQVNGAPLAITFSPKSSELQNTSRLPVTIDSTSSFALTDGGASQTKLEYPSQQRVIRGEDAQQAQFVRLLATDNKSFSQQEPKPLPVGVQQYLKIAELSSESAQRLFDETV
ncbi:MAG: hypothetical protein ACKE9I_05715 [Methylophagaceae bacterium]